MRTKICIPVTKKKSDEKGYDYMSDVKKIRIIKCILHRKIRKLDRY